MSAPTITAEEPAALADRISEFMPAQGSFEYQHDQAGKTHNWHRHSLNETLFVLDGEVEIFWQDGGSVHRHSCTANTRIALPAGTVHGSTAGASGCTYLIAPEGGATAVTTFLDPSEYPTG